MVNCDPRRTRAVFVRDLHAALLDKVPYPGLPARTHVDRVAGAVGEDIMIIFPGLRYRLIIPRIYYRFQLRRLLLGHRMLALLDLDICYGTDEADPSMVALLYLSRIARDVADCITSGAVLLTPPLE